MPGGVNLLFTLLLWTFFLIIFLSNHKNKINQWCFISGMIFSLGVLKEYFFFDLVPFLAQNKLMTFSPQQAEFIYSVMTALLYLLVMPSSLIFSLYFAEYYFKNKKPLFRIQLVMVLLIVILSLVYHPAQFRQYQLNSKLFWVLISAYNLTYGAILTSIMLRAVRHERNTTWKRQKRRVNILVLPLLWFWLITIFIIHTLNIKPLFHVWQGNVVLLLILLGYYMVMAFREGIMGVKLKAVSYKWGSEARMAQKSTHYLNHFLKNEVAKIEWCTNNLSNRFGSEVPEEVGIIFHSVDHIKNLVQKTQSYSKDIQLNYSICSLYELINSCVEDTRKRLLDKDIDFKINCGQNICVKCDAMHLSEVLNNLLNNAVEAIEKSGIVFIDFSVDDKRKKYILSVKDNGIGIDKESLSHLFEPYYTNKSGPDHFGLGLFYCYRVMEKHSGSIEVKSETGIGSVFSLYFPKDFCCFDEKEAK